VEKYVDHPPNISLLMNVNAIFLPAICHSVWQAPDIGVVNGVKAKYTGIFRDLTIQWFTE
jgi:hypothetical protein